MIHTIRAKFIIGFFLIFCVFFLLLNQWVARNIESGNRNMITESLIDLKNNSNAYIRQSFLTHHFVNDEIYFGQMAQELIRDLQYTTSSVVGMYSLEGELLASSDPGIFTMTGEDLKEALQGRTAYTITYADGKASVLYAYPVVSGGVKVGIVRFAKDFTTLYEQSSQIQRTIFLIALAIFAAAFLFSYLLSRHITVPLVKLTKVSTDVMNGNLDVRIDIRRKDEIGKLAANFSSMIRKIRNQFIKIKEDRDRLEELNHERKRFFDNVTHELKTPLTTIMGYAEIIRENGTQDPEFFQKGMNHIVDESRRLHEMVLNLLAKSKQVSDSEAFAAVDAGELLRDVCETMMLKAKQRYKQTICCETEQGLFIHGHSGKLRQLFINLLDNAIKYGSAHSHIEVRAVRDADTIRIKVSNHGETIPPEHLAKIFEPFYRGTNLAQETESAGLGLGICKEIVQEHEGTISITSEHGQTTISIDLPYLLTKGEWE